MKLYFTTLLACLLCTLLPSTAQESGEHQLGPGDSVDINVFQEPDLNSLKVLVSKEGRITVQLLGDVDVSGLTASQAARLIETKFKPGYLVHPRVTVSISGLAQRRFTVLGQVNKPGAFNFPAGQNLTVEEAIGMAGGFKAGAKVKKVLLKHSGGGEPTEIDLSKDAKSKATQVQTGDVITVPEKLF